MTKERPGTTEARPGVEENRRGHLLRLLRGETHSAEERLTAAGLRALAGVYGLGVRARNAAYRWGLVRRTRLPALVVSVGNITFGGTGKTTTCLAVAEWFLSQGKKVALVSRGYRGRSEDGICVVSEGAGPRVDAETAGDEPYLVARTLPAVRVLVGRNRRRTGRLAVERYGAEVILLDDGFQHQRLARDLDIVLVDALAPFGYDCPGLLREPVSALGRAQAVWLTHCDLVRRQDTAAIRARVEQAAPGARLWETRHAPVALRELATGQRRPPEVLCDARIVALSGLGNPASFERVLERLGAQVVGHARFPDHHRYEAAEVRETLRTLGAGAEWIVTTEKDAVRLPEAALDRPTWVLEIALAGLPGGPTLAEELTCLLAGEDGRRPPTSGN